MIARVGVEDAGELVALATSEQLAELFDLDLWRSDRAGDDERFDAGRFVLWLEVMLEAGERFVAERLAELSPDLLTLALHRKVLVLSLADLAEELQAGDDDAELAEKALSDCLSEELDDYQLIWRGGEGWDTVLSALLALDSDHHSLVVDLLERCAALSRAQLEDGDGLASVLGAEETLEEDVAGEREERRAQRGYVAPSAAKAFLRLARAPEQETPFTERDALTRAYFRNLAPASLAPARATPVTGLLRGSRAVEEPLVIQELRALAERGPELFTQRSEELAYLVNVLLAAHEIDGRRLRPYEAVELALRTVSRGLAAVGREQLARCGCDGLFRLAWSRGL